MATLYHLHSTLDGLKRSTEKLALTWQAGDSLILLGTTVAFIEWLQVCLTEQNIQSISAMYALTTDVAQLPPCTLIELNLEARLTQILTDDAWVHLTQDPQFDKVVTVAS